MSISVGSLSMLQGYIAKGYSATAIRDIMGDAVPRETVQSMVAAKCCVLDLEHQAKLAREREAAKLARRTAMERARKERERARAVDMYRVISIRGGGRSPQEILQETAQAHGLTVRDLVCDSRVRALCPARQEAMYLFARDTTLSFPAIGRRIGKRDHTTIIYGIRRHCARHNLPLPRGMKPEGTV